MDERDLPCLVQVDSIGAAVKQLYPQFLLQLFEHGAHGRLGDVELVRGLCQRTALRNDLEVFHGSNVHVSSLA